MTSSGFGGGSIPTVAGTTAGVVVGAALLPQTGSNFVIDALVIVSVAAVVMFVSMSISKAIKKASN